MNINSNSKSTRSGAKGINKSLTDECDPAGSHSSAAALWLRVLPWETRPCGIVSCSSI